MALPVNIENLVNGESVEWERLEFKAGWNPEDVVHTLCAFANDLNNWGGGYVIVGVAEQDGRPVLPPVGLPPAQLDRIQGELLGLSRQLQPNYLPVVQPSVLLGQHILVIWVPAGDQRPYSAPSTQGQNARRQYYIRTGSRSVVATGVYEQRLLALTARIPFDDRVNQQARVEDLQLGLLRDYLQEVRSELFAESSRVELSVLAQQMQLARGPAEHLLPLNVGLLFFNPEPERLFPRAWIEVVIHEGDTGQRFTEKTFKGPLHKQLRDCLAYLQAVVVGERTTKVSGRAEAARTFNFPYDAVEEAVSNAVYHKSYEEAKPVEIQVFPDAMHVLSFPGPVAPVDQAMLQRERIIARDYRNRRLGDFLKELRLAEGRGTGIPLIRRRMRENNSPEPQFETDADRTYFLVVLPVHPAWLPASNQVGNQVSNQVGDQAEDELPVAIGEAYWQYLARLVREITEQGRSLDDSAADRYRPVVQFLEPDYAAVLRACQTPKSRKDVLEETLQRSNQLKNAKRFLDPLLAHGFLARTIPESPNSPTQKYATTERGRLALRLLERSKTS
jgi:ATP-dependent DNA helicase RecG